MKIVVVLLCTIVSLPSPGAGEGSGLTLGTVNFAAEGDARQRTSPWMVALGVYEEEQFLVECSGSLLTPGIVVTAAHCLHTPGLVARAGVSNLRYRGGQEARVRSVVLHPAYTPPRVYYDVGLARLEGSLQLSAKVAPLCLPASPMVPGSLREEARC